MAGGCSRDPACLEHGIQLGTWDTESRGPSWPVVTGVPRGWGLWVCTELLGAQACGREASATWSSTQLPCGAGQC